MILKITDIFLNQKEKRQEKFFNELEKKLMFKKFYGDIDSVYYQDLDNYDDDDNNYDENWKH